MVSEHLQITIYNELYKVAWSDNMSHLTQSLVSNSTTDSNYFRIIAESLLPSANGQEDFGTLGYYGHI